VRVRVDIDDGGMPLLVEFDVVPSLQELDRVEDVLELLGGTMSDFDRLVEGKLRPKALKAIIFVKVAAEFEDQYDLMVSRHGEGSAEVEVARRRADQLTTESFDCDLGDIGTILLAAQVADAADLEASLPVDPVGE